MLVVNSKNSACLQFHQEIVLPIAPEFSMLQLGTLAYYKRLGKLSLFWKIVGGPYSANWGDARNCLPKGYWYSECSFVIRSSDSENNIFYLGKWTDIVIELNDNSCVNLACKIAHRYEAYTQLNATVTFK